MKRDLTIGLAVAAAAAYLLFLRTNHSIDPRSLAPVPPPRPPHLDSSANGAIGAGEIRGNVVNADGKPLPDSLVTAAAVRNGEEPRDGRFRPIRTRTDEQGHFNLRGLVHGEYKIRAVHDGGPSLSVLRLPPMTVQLHDEQSVELGPLILR